MGLGRMGRHCGFLAASRAPALGSRPGVTLTSCVERLSCSGRLKLPFVCMYHDDI